MPRASCVYILRSYMTGKLLMAWTVRHEMVYFLQHCQITRERQETMFEVVRLPDGREKEEFIIPWKEIDE